MGRKKAQPVVSEDDKARQEMAREWLLLVLPAGSVHKQVKRKQIAGVSLVDLAERLADLCICLYRRYEEESPYGEWPGENRLSSYRSTDLARADDELQKMSPAVGALLLGLTEQQLLNAQSIDQTFVFVGGRRF